MLFAKKINFIISICATILLSSPALYSAGLENSTSSSKAHNDTLTNSLLIFLLDNYEKTYDLITSDLITALIQKSSPILASATLIKHIKDSSAGKFLPTEDLITLNAYSIINGAIPSESQKRRSKNVIMHVSDLKNSINKDWIIKEVNEFLYLLLPKSYLTERGITVEDVNEVLNKEDPITETEQILSFKVNHLKTVTLESTQNPEEHDSIDYFVPSLKNIFLTQNEYVNAGAIAPKLAMYIVGHGLTNYMICGLSIQNFKDFLQFLEKLNMSVLVYNSCYAGGTNIELVYKDSAANINKTYDFTIINKSITDVESRGFYLYTELNNEKIEIKPYYNFKCFIEKLNNPTTVNFIDALECLSPLTLMSNIPQIRYPGLPWFSILDTKKVASIGKIMAKTRSKPLNIATYFAKEGKPAAPLGILLYDHNIPFELIIDTKNQYSDVCYVPIFASMIIGDATHHLTKITSTCNTITDILNSFFISGLMRHKRFFIDEITAPLSQLLSNLLTNNTETHGTIRQVIVDLTPGVPQKIYFTFNDQIYYVENYLTETNVPKLATEAQKTEYFSLHIKEANPELMQLLKQVISLTFQSPMNYTTALSNIIKIFNFMQNNTTTNIPVIWGLECPPENMFCWFEILNALTAYHPDNTNKIILINNLALVRPSISQPNLDIYWALKNIIVEINSQETNVYYTDLSPPTRGFYKLSHLANDSNTPTYRTKLINDYTRAFATIFSTPDTSRTFNLEANPIHQQLTPERIAQMKMVLEKKYLNLKNANK